MFSKLIYLYASYFTGEGKSEILFKGFHVTHLPWMEYSKWDQIPPLPRNEHVPYQNVEVTVEKLCHITHDEEYKEITKDTKYVFKPRQKFGKVGYRNHFREQVGKSYVRCDVPSALPPNYQTDYRCVREDEEILPGYYIWWSIDHSCIPTMDLTKTIRSGYYSSEPFQTPIKSHYGNHKITCNIRELLQCYQNAYGSPLPRIEFRCGGTLRYRNEICYVVIVCAVHPDSEHSLSNFPVMNLEVQYGLNEEVVSVETPQLRICNGISGVYYHHVDLENKSYSWDTYAFALHFPNETFTLKLPKGDKIFDEKITHDKPCLKGKPDPSKCSKKFVCPNDLDVVAVDTTESDNNDFFK